MTGGFYGFHAAARSARVLLAGAACVVSCAQAQTISQAWERALAAEPAVQAARASQRAAAQRTEQARAAFLPQVDMAINRQTNRRSFIQEIESEAPLPEQSERYPSRTAQVNITQPLYRPANWSALQQARASERQAALQALVAEQDLQARFFAAWFDAMAARDNVQQAVEQANATRQQLAVMERGERLGSYSEVQAAEARARHEQAVAEHAAAQADLAGKLALLEQVTGALPDFALPVLQVAAVGAALPGPGPLAPWTDRAQAGSPAIRAAERAVAAAREEVNRQQALHMPTLDLVARHARVLQGSGNSPGQAGYRSREHSIGLQLNMPLFSGGATTAKVREAQAMVDKAEADLEGARRTALSQAQQAWSAVQGAQARAQGADHALRAAELALQAALTGQSTGLKTPLDELQARQQFATARRDQQRAHYDRVVALVSLHTAAGQPAHDLLVQVEALLAATPTASAR